MKKYFWEDWSGLSKSEKFAINSIKKAKRILFNHVPRREVHSIYLKGSFVRPEMNRKSDVDMVVITYYNKSRDNIKILERNEGHLYKPTELIPHSLNEFKLGKIKSEKGSLKGSPDITLRDIHRYRLIYGKKVDPKDFPIRSDIEFLKGHLWAFRETFIPLYNAGDFGFSELMKQVFHLVEREKRVEGTEPPETWKELAKSIKDKNHIVHDVLKYRLNPTKNPSERKSLMKKLERYLDKLEKKYLGQNE